MEGIKVSGIEPEDIGKNPVNLLCPCGCNETVKGKWLRLDLNLNTFYAPLTCPTSDNTYILSAYLLKGLKP